MDWGLVQKVLIPGERREFFSAGKNIWKVARLIVKERKKLELDQMIPVLKELCEVEGKPRDKAVKTFTDTIQNLRKFSEQADKTLDTMIRADEHWFLSSLVKLFGAASR
jgi:DNA-binding transcriptional regulator GbsR (MarR family)